jgi:hypothetical protein
MAQGCSVVETQVETAAVSDETAAVDETAEAVSDRLQGTLGRNVSELRVAGRNVSERLQGTLVGRNVSELQAVVFVEEEVE